ncbi:hypothetical protein JCM19233_249 [Vibrio astriarenae]|nr:hypothetical protein JCM19233_249 [Vibrio sp. C7]
MNLKPLVFECLADISEHSINSLADWVGAEHINANELASHTYKKAHELLRRAGLLSVNALELRA